MWLNGFPWQSNVLRLKNVEHFVWTGNKTFTGSCVVENKINKIKYLHILIKIPTHILWTRHATCDIMNGIGNDTHSTIFVSESSSRYSFAIILTLCILLICYNSLLIYCIVTNRKQAWAMRAKQVFYLILSELLISIIWVPRLTFEAFLIPRETYEKCSAINFTTVTTQLISYNHVLSLCIHRFMMIRKAHLPSGVDRSRYGIESLLIWVTVAVTCVPPYVIWGRHEEVLTDCRFLNLFGPSDTAAVVYILVLLCVPWILTNGIYLAMILRMMSTARIQTSVAHGAAGLRAAGTNGESFNLDNQGTTNQPAAPALGDQITTTQPTVPACANQVTTNEPVAQASATQKQPSGPQIYFTRERNKRVIKTVCYLLIAFNISILPLVLVPSMMLNGKQDSLPQQIQPLIFLNNICNPLVYTFSFTHLRDEVKRVLRRGISRIQAVLLCKTRV